MKCKNCDEKVFTTVMNPENYCDDCQAALEDKWDREREMRKEERMEDE